MTNETPPRPATRLRRALANPDASVRLQAALTAGSTPDAEYVRELIDRCAVEPDFYVRDMLTWALIRNDRSTVVADLLVELSSEIPQARAQALHTLSKIGDPDTWPAITTAHLADQDDEVARAAWRTAVGLVPEGRVAELADLLVAQLGRGDRDLRLSLSRALVELGGGADAALDRAAAAIDPVVREHAIATQRLMLDPEEGFDAAVAEARRVVAVRNAPVVPPVVPPVVSSAVPSVAAE